MKSSAKKIFSFSKRYSRIIFMLFFAAFSLYGLHIITSHARQWIKSALFTCPTIDIVCTNFYSPQIKRQIVAFTQSYVSNANYLSFDATNFYSSLKEHFDCVTRVTITKRLPMGFSIKIKGVDPIMRINNTCILATDRGIYKNDDFSKFTELEALPALTVPNVVPGMKITQAAYDDLKQLASSYVKDYACTYNTPSCIQLIPRKPQRYTSILTNREMFTNGIDQQMLDSVVEDTMKRGLCSQKTLDKKIRSIELDMRFEQRIIVKMIDHGKKRGRGV